MHCDIHVQCHRLISLVVYANNVKCIYSCGPGHNVDCSEFI